MSVVCNTRLYCLNLGLKPFSVSFAGMSQVILTTTTLQEGQRLGKLVPSCSHNFVLHHRSIIHDDSPLLQLSQGDTVMVLPHVPIKPMWLNLILFLPRTDTVRRCCKYVVIGVRECIGSHIMLIGTYALTYEYLGKPRDRIRSMYDFICIGSHRMYTHRCFRHL